MKQTLCRCYYANTDMTAYYHHMSCPIHVFAGQLEGLYISAEAPLDDDERFRHFLI